MKKVGAIILGLLVFVFVCRILPPLSKIIMLIIANAFNVSPSPGFNNNFEAAVIGGTIIVSALIGRQVYRAIVKPEVTYKSFRFQKW